MKFRLFFILFSLICINSFFDQPRYSSSFTSENKQFQLSQSNRLSGNYQSLETWELKDNVNNTVLYKFQYNLSDCTVFISNNGKNIIVIDDYSFGTLGDDNIILSFIINGIIQKEYTFKDLLDCTDNITLSASHIKWVFSNSFSLKDNIFKFITYELYEYSINIDTGKIINKKHDSRLSGNVIYAYGTVTNNNDGTYNFEIMQLVYGNPIRGKIIFKNGLNKHFNNGYYYTLIIRDNVAIYENDVLFNLCTYRKR